MGLCQTKPTLVDPDRTYCTKIITDCPKGKPVESMRNVSRSTFDIYGYWLPTKKSTDVTFTFPCGTVLMVPTVPHYQCSRMNRQCVLRGECPAPPRFDGYMVTAEVSVGTGVNILHTYRHEKNVSHC